MKIQAAVLHEVRSPFVVETLDLAEPRAGEVLVKMRAVGVCRSDWHLVTGDTEHPLPVVAGHEGAGIVAAVGERVDALSVGDLVTLNWAPACRDCFYCRAGRPNLCETYLEPIWAGTMLDGTARLSRDGHPVFHYCGLAAFADHAVVPAAACVKMPNDLPHKVAALIGCAVATGVGAVLNTAKIQRGSGIAVFGSGGIGLAMIMAANLAGAERIVAVDPLPARRQFALSIGATEAIPPEAAIDEIRKLTAGRGADCVFEAVGDPGVQEQCLAAARPGGSVIFAGLAPMGSQTNLPGAILTRQEKTVAGCYYGTTDAVRDFPRYAELFSSGKLPLDRLATAEYSLAEINEAYRAMLAGETARGVIVFD